MVHDDIPPVECDPDPPFPLLDRIREFVPAVDPGEEIRGPYLVMVGDVAWQVARSRRAALCVQAEPETELQSRLTDPEETLIFRAFLKLRIDPEDIEETLELDDRAVELAELAWAAKETQRGGWFAYGAYEPARGDHILFELEAARILPFQALGEVRLVGLAHHALGLSATVADTPLFMLSAEADTRWPSWRFMIEGRWPR